MDDAVYLDTGRLADAAMREPVRAALLVALVDGRALTAAELARAARITSPTVGAHLTRMVDAGLLRIDKQGRHRYYRLATPAIALRVENAMEAAPTPAAAGRGSVTVGPRDAALRAARTCYDHVAGRLGVAISDRLLEEAAIEFDGDVGFVTERGARLIAALGIDAVLAGERLSRSRRALCRPCLDWSERRPHLAGKLGAAILLRWLDQGWVCRSAGSRTLSVTPAGRDGMRDRLGLVWER